MKYDIIERDNTIVNTILAKTSLNERDRMQLINILHTSYHLDGKIEGIYSLDSSATACDFCAKMREAAEHDHTIICNMCYDIAQERFKKSARERHALNRKILTSVLFTTEELACLNLGYSAIVRYNSSGETDNTIQARNYIRTSYAHPDAHTALWGKNVRAITEAIELDGKPDNLVLVQSSPRIGVPVTKAKYFDYTFTAYATQEGIREALSYGDNECNGKKCIECGFKCYLNTHDGSYNICEYLRCSKAKRQELITLGCR